jgi:hypothetical protein
VFPEAVMAKMMVSPSGAEKVWLSIIAGAALGLRQLISGFSFAD